MKVAIFKNIQYNSESVLTEEFESIDGYVRVTEYADVEFIRLKDKSVTTKEVATLEGVKKKILAETEVKIGSIDRRIGELLALTHDA